MEHHADLIEPLTTRELKILSLIGEGMSYGEIGQALFIEKATVTWYVQQIYDKLGLEKSERNHQKALVCAQALGLLGSRAAASEQEKVRLSIKNPYKGLRSFQQGDAGEFFGREALIQQLLLRLGETGPMARFLAVVGPSGCGKSSAIHAGLIPALQRGGIEGSERWVIASMIPGSHPLDELEACLVRVSAKIGIDIMAQLLRDERGLQRLAGMLLPDHDELLLVVDQFEEVFSLVVDDSQRRQFLALLGCSVNQPHSRVRVVIALRADYYDRPLISPTISELFRFRTEVVAPLTPDELAQAICLPAKHAEVQVESGLVNAMVDEVSERPGLLPLMQYSLTELFDRRQGETMSLAIYHQIGGIRGALTRRADVLYESLNTSQQALLRQIFLRLVKLGAEGEVLRRRVSRSELQSIEKNTQAVDELIDALADYRLLTLDYDPATGSALVEVAHEALIREWGQLRAWLDDSREDIRQQRLLAAAASDWREANRDPSYLLSGAHLVQFQSWAHTSQIELGPVESEFLTTSINEKQRHDHRRRLIRNLIFGAVAIVAIVMSALALIALDQERQAHDAAIRAERRTQENRSIQLASNAQAAYAEGRTDLALLLAMKAVDMTDPPDLSDQIFRTIAQGPGIRAVLSTYLRPITTVSISPDKKLVMVGGCLFRKLDMTCQQSKVIVMDIKGDASYLSKGQDIILLENIEYDGAVNDVLFNPVDTPDGRPTALSAYENGSIILWDVSPLLAGKVINRYDGHAGAVNEVAFSPDGKQFIAAYDQGMIIFWDTASGKEVQRLNGGSGAVTSVAFSQDGQMVLSASEDGTTTLWSVANKTEIRRYLCPPDVWVTRVTFGPVNRYGRATVWGLTTNNSVSVWDLETANQIGGIPPGSNPYRDVAFTMDGETVALAFEGMIILKNPDQGSDEQRLMQISEATNNSITALAISRDDSLLISGSDGGNIELWNLPIRDDLDVESVEGATSLGNTVLFPDKTHMLSSTGSSDTITPTLVNINLLTNVVDVHYAELPNQVAPNALAIDPQGRFLLVGGGNQEGSYFDTAERPFLWILDASSGEVLHKLQGHKHNINAVAISPDGQTALSGSAFIMEGSLFGMSGEFFLWDTDTGQLLREFTSVNGIQGIAFSHDGKLAVTCAQTGIAPYVSVWEVASGKRLTSFSYGCLDAAFSLDDKAILINAMTESSISRIYKIDINNGKIQRTFAGLDGPIVNFVIDPDNRFLFAASRTMAILWDVNSGQEFSRFDLPSPGAITWAVFPSLISPADYGNVILVQDNTNQLIRWYINQLPSLTYLQIWILQNRYIRPFTCEEKELYEIQPYCNE